MQGLLVGHELDPAGRRASHSRVLALAPPGPWRQAGRRGDWVSGGQEAVGLHWGKRGRPRAGFALPSLSSRLASRVLGTVVESVGSEPFCMALGSGSVETGSVALGKPLNCPVPQLPRL